MRLHRCSYIRTPPVFAGGSINFGMTKEKEALVDSPLLLFVYGGIIKLLFLLRCKGTFNKKRGDDMGIMTVKQAAEKWGITPRRVQELIRTGRIESAYKLARDFVMPDDTEKPSDLRKERYKKRTKND